MKLKIVRLKRNKEPVCVIENKRIPSEDLLNFIDHYTSPYACEYKVFKFNLPLVIAWGSQCAIRPSNGAFDLSNAEFLFEDEIESAFSSNDGWIDVTKGKPDE